MRSLNPYGDGVRGGDGARIPFKWFETFFRSRRHCFELKNVREKKKNKIYKKNLNHLKGTLDILVLRRKREESEVKRVVHGYDIEPSATYQKPLRVFS